LKHKLFLLTVTAILIFSFTANAAGPGPGYEPGDFVKLIFEQGVGAAQTKKWSCDANDGICAVMNRNDGDGYGPCLTRCGAAYYEAGCEALLAYTDYLREYLSTESNLKKVYEMSETDFEQFSSSYDGVLPTYSEDGLWEELSFYAGQNWHRLHMLEWGFEEISQKYGVTVPASFYQKYVGTIPLQNGGDLPHSNPDVAIIETKFLPHLAKSYAEATEMIETIRAEREKIKTQNVAPAPQYESQESASTEVPAVPQPKEKGVSVINSVRAKVDAAIQKALTEGLSADEADQIRKEVRTYQIKVPDMVPGKYAIVGFPEEKTVSTIIATAGQPVQNMAIQADFFDINKYPQLFDKSVLIHDPDYPTPDIPPPGEEFQPIELIGLKSGWVGTVDNQVSTADNMIESFTKYGGVSYFDEYYFTFRLPPEIIVAGKNAVPQKTSSGDYIIDASTDLNSIKLLHYNAETGRWDKVSTKSVGKCDLKFCVFTAGPASGKSYYIIVKEEPVTKSTGWILIMLAVIEIIIIVGLYLWLKRKINPQNKSEGKGIASLVLGILSIILIMAPYVGFLLAGFSLVFSRIQLATKPTKISRAGFVLSIIGICLNVMTFIFLIVSQFAFGG
jgi:hypothetical protein